VSCGRIGYCSRVGRYSLQRGIRAKRLANLDTGGCKDSAQFGIKHLMGLTFDNAVEFFIELEIKCMYRVRRFF